MFFCWFLYRLHHNHHKVGELEKLLYIYLTTMIIKDVFLHVQMVRRRPQATELCIKKFAIQVEAAVIIPFGETPLTFATLNPRSSKYSPCLTKYWMNNDYSYIIIITKEHFLLSPWPDQSLSPHLPICACVCVCMRVCVGVRLYLSLPHTPLSISFLLHLSTSMKSSPVIFFLDDIISLDMYNPHALPRARKTHTMYRMSLPSLQILNSFCA